jgi:glycosyltransferase involved in cell wall biosynthesis
MKSVLYCISSYKIGITAQLTEQAIMLSRIYRNIFLFISGENEQYNGLKERLKNEDVNHKIIKGFDIHKNIIYLIRNINNMIIELKPDTIVTQTNWQIILFIITKYIYGYKYKIIYIVRGYRHNEYLKSFIARYIIGLILFLFAHKVVTPSSYVKEKFFMIKHKAKVIFLGEENKYFNSVKPPRFNGNLRLIFAGEFRKGKNQEVLINAIKNVILDTGFNSIYLILPGKGEKLERCKELVRKYNLLDNVIFPGFLDRDNVYNLYLSCQFAIIPSNVETFGHCIVEPYLLGRVVITREVGVANDIIINEYNGIIFKNENDLIEKIKNLLMNEDLCGKISNNTLLHREKFKWEYVCKRLYEEVL